LTDQEVRYPLDMAFRNGCPSCSEHAENGANHQIRVAADGPEVLTDIAIADQKGPPCSTARNPWKGVPVVVATPLGFMAIARGPPMVQIASVTSHERLERLTAAFSRPDREFSALRVIGGRLRALYDDFPQPCPARVIQLLRALDDGDAVRH
jgi:hypothetical protein